MVCPSNEKCGIILPVEVAFEEVGSWAIRWTINKDDTSLGGAIVYLDALPKIEIQCRDTMKEEHTRSFAHAISLPRHRTCHMGPSPLCRMVSLCPSHPFSRKIRFPPKPPQTNDLVVRFAKLGSMEIVRIGRFISKEYDSEVDKERIATCPKGGI
jgi:hypothetical protein